MTPDPNAAPFTLSYVAAQIGWVAAILALLVLGVLAWERFERRLVDRHSATIHTFPERSASITRIYGDSGEAS